MQEHTFSGTPKNEDVGTITVKVTATDGSSASIFETFNIVVTNTNDAPTINSTAVTSQTKTHSWLYL